MKGLCLPDKRNIELEISQDALNDLLSEVTVSPKVPTRLRDMIQLARQICLYAYFEYEFYTLCAVYLFLVVETAIKERFLSELSDKCHMIRGKESQIVNRNYETIMQRLWEGWVIVGYEEVNTSLWSILKWLKKNQILPERVGKKEIELIRQLRNNCVHIRSTEVYSPNLIIPIMWKVTDLINCLFDSSAHEKEPRILKQQKESHRQMSQWLERVIKQVSDRLKDREKEKDNGKS